MNTRSFQKYLCIFQPYSGSHFSDFFHQVACMSALPLFYHMKILKTMAGTATITNL